MVQLDPIQSRWAARNSLGCSDFFSRGKACCEDRTSQRGATLQAPGGFGCSPCWGLLLPRCHCLTSLGSQLSSFSQRIKSGRTTKDTYGSRSKVIWLRWWPVRGVKGAVMPTGHKAGFRLQRKVEAGCLAANWTSDFKDSVCFPKASEHPRFPAALCPSFPAGGNGPELLLKVCR